MLKGKMPEKTQKKWKSGIFLSALVLCLVSGAAFLVFLLYFFAPGGQAVPELLFGEGVFGFRQDNLKALVDGREQTLRVYVANLHQEPEHPGREQTALLTGLLLSPGKKDEPNSVNWKVGRGYIGVTHDHREVFYPGWWGLIAGEGVHTTFLLEDDMKGMNAEYTIADRGASLEYAVVLPPGNGARNVSFSIPKKLLGITEEKVFPEILHIMPYRAPAASRTAPLP